MECTPPEMANEPNGSDGPRSAEWQSCFRYANGTTLHVAYQRALVLLPRERYSAVVAEILPAVFRAAPIRRWDSEGTKFAVKVPVHCTHVYFNVNIYILQ